MILTPRDGRKKKRKRSEAERKENKQYPVAYHSVFRPSFRIAIRKPSSYTVVIRHVENVRNIAYTVLYTRIVVINAHDSIDIKLHHSMS